MLIHMQICQSLSASLARLDSVELVPFASSINAGAGMVMTAHIALPAVQGDSTTPATLAPKVITGLLRKQLQFTGLAITDAMTMGGIGKGYTARKRARCWPCSRERTCCSSRPTQQKQLMPLSLPSNAAQFRVHVLIRAVRKGARAQSTNWRCVSPARGTRQFA